jgi:hypothetical protein
MRKWLAAVLCVMLLGCLVVALPEQAVRTETVVPVADGPQPPPDANVVRPIGPITSLGAVGGERLPLNV